MRFFLAGALTMFLAGCAEMAPPELMSARQAYDRASHGQAVQLAPAEVHKAHESLVVAERAFADDGVTLKTRDLAYIAERKAELAEAIAAREADKQKRAKADAELRAGEEKLIAQQRTTLDEERQELSETERARMDAERDKKVANQQLGVERQARAAADAKAADAEQRVKDAQIALAKLAAVKEEERGMVITLSGSVLFASNQATLLPEAMDRLSQVADALMSTKERNIIIEGHTDSRGGDSYNVELSQRRAEAVREFLVRRGYEPDRIQARGMGKARPIADNANAEGRANNRRVEIVVEKKKLDY
jgi:outer membrane protein OmpA-like peptidoglycan-associated protein